MSSIPITLDVNLQAFQEECFEIVVFFSVAAAIEIMILSVNHLDFGKFFRNIFILASFISFFLKRLFWLDVIKRAIMIDKVFVLDENSYFSGNFFFWK
tara:strand:+ start:307 stop:600 length:294 start_codon:yes stop_codon:yes gene_type:complete